MDFFRVVRMVAFFTVTDSAMRNGYFGRQAHLLRTQFSRIILALTYTLF